jgi:hypothetical protein
VYLFFHTPDGPFGWCFALKKHCYYHSSYLIIKYSISFLIYMSFWFFLDTQLLLCVYTYRISRAVHLETTTYNLWQRVIYTWVQFKCMPRTFGWETLCKLLLHILAWSLITRVIG